MFASQSSVRDWTHCKYLYKLRVINEITPRFTPRPMSIGTLVHKGFDVAWRTASVLAACDAIAEHQAQALESDTVREYLTDEQRDQALLDTAAAQSIFERGWLALEPDAWEVITTADGTPLIEFAMRQHFAKPIGGLVQDGGPPIEGVQGTLDFALKNRATGHRWLFDLKVPKVLASEDFYATQTQAPVYQHLLRTLHGVELDGSAIYQVRAAVPSTPELNKTLAKGEQRPRMSRSGLSTDWATYRRALLANGLQPAEYADVEAKLKSFERVDYFMSTPQYVQRVWDDFSCHVADMASALSFPRSLNPHNCRGCHHRAYCTADLEGMDTQVLERTTYQRPGVDGFFMAMESDDDNDGGGFYL